jgi:hypothetical protein
MTYKITNFDVNLGSLSVKFIENSLPCIIKVPINADGFYIVGEELTKYIESHSPTTLIDRNIKVAKGIPNTEELENFVIENKLKDTELPITSTLQRMNNQKMWEDIQYEQKIAKVLVKLGVLSSDSTKISITYL